MAKPTKKTAKKKPAAKKKTRAKKKAGTAKGARTKSGSVASKAAALKTTAKKNTAAGGSESIRAARSIVAALRDRALSYPETHEDFPWDHLVVKVRKKVFIFLDRLDIVEEQVRFSVKLPHSNGMALALPFATPTGYGMAKSGWVSFAFEAAEAPPMDVMAAWLDESFRAIAPKKLQKLL